MPRGDGTGPVGIGSKIGRGAGFKMPDSRAGRGMWFGRGRGCRRMFWLIGLLPGCVYLARQWANRSKMLK